MTFDLFECNQKDEITVGRRLNVSLFMHRQAARLENWITIFADGKCWKRNFPCSPAAFLPRLQEAFLTFLSVKVRRGKRENIFIEIFRTKRRRRTMESTKRGDKFINTQLRWRKAMAIKFYYLDALIARDFPRHPARHLSSSHGWRLIVKTSRSETIGLWGSHDNLLSSMAGRSWRVICPNQWHRNDTTKESS